MANLSTGDLLISRVACYQQSQLGINVLHWRFVLSSGFVSDADFAAYLSGLLAPLYKAVLADAATFYGIQVQVYYPIALAPVVVNVDQGLGSVAGDPLPLQTSGIITKKTVLAGRKYRGRIYIPFPSEGDSESTGKPSTTYKTNLAPIATATCTARTVTTLDGEGVFYPTLHHVLTPSLPTDVIQGLGHQRWAVQRRRGDYGRTNTVPPWGD